MLSPGNRVILLPCDREIMELAGLTEAEYREFVRQCRFESKLRPGEPVALEPLTLGLILVGVGAALFTAGVLLAPKPKSQQPSGSPTIGQRDVRGQQLTDGRRFAPKSGFDSLQNVVELGSTVPLIYARRELIGGVAYGGVRVNTNLLWSQVLSLGGDQLLRAIYLVGEGDDRANSMELDPSQFALGNNLLGSYDLNANSRSRVAIYYNDDGGRLVSGDNIAGSPANQDPGNFSTAPQNGPDVFSVAGAGNVQGQNFCYAFKPSTQTSIGNFGWIGNGVCYKVNPSIGPAVRLSTVPAGANTPNFNVICPVDTQQQALRQKNGFEFPTNAGVTAGAGNLAVGASVTYTLSSALSRSGDFIQAPPAGGTERGELSPDDGNQAVASRQTSFDEAITIGELYRIGSALAICTSRTGSPFVSQAQNGNQSVTATFEVIRAGVHSGAVGTGGTSNMTQVSQIFRTSIGNFVTEYPCQALEVGMRSTVGLQISGLGYMNDPEYDYTLVDNAACLVYAGGPYAPTAILNPRIVTNGSISTPETRYSCFRIGYRRAGTNDAFTMLSNIYGVRSETSQAVYNYWRFEMPNTSRWEFEFEPISGWEIRSGTGGGNLEICDPKVAAVRSVTDGAVTVRFNGLMVYPAAANGGQRLNGGTISGVTFPGIQPINAIQATEDELRYDGTSLSDQFARVAEAFPHNEITTTVGGNPEHEIVYVNTILPNTTAADYENLAILGMNIRASREFGNLSQFSVYMNRGLGGFHDFPSVLQDMLTNTRYGLGDIVSGQQIDTASFTAATTFTTGRRYYFDGTISEPLNIRQWATDTARDFLLDLIIRNGRWSLQPTVVFDAPEPLTGIFTAGNIIEGSFELNYFDQDQRQQPRISVKWRQEMSTGDAANRGLFPIVREVTVAEISVAGNAPRESIDLSNFCTSQLHAIDRAKFECRFRRYSTHSVKFKTTTDQAALDLGKCFKLGLETLAFNQPANGYIAADGTVTSWPALADGNYQALVWNGAGQTVQEVALTITNGNSATNRGAVFCIADAQAITQTYKVQSLAFDEDGNLDVEAIHWPTDDDGHSLITENWDDAFFDIDGAV